MLSVDLGQVQLTVTSHRSFHVIIPALYRSRSFSGSAGTRWDESIHFTSILLLSLSMWAHNYTTIMWLLIFTRRLHRERGENLKIQEIDFYLRRRRWRLIGSKSQGNKSARYTSHRHSCSWFPIWFNLTIFSINLLSSLLNIASIRSRNAQFYL